MGAPEYGQQTEGREAPASVLEPKELESGLSTGGDADTSGNENGIAENSSLIVDWDGPDDPENPHNWSGKKKAITIAIVSTCTFITPLASSIFAPSIESVMAEFNSNSSVLSSFIVSVYLIGYCLGPLVIAPLSEMYGRNMLYNICNVLFVIFTIACAVAPSLGVLIFFRLCSGLAGSSPLTLGAGSIADMIGPEKRGLMMSWWICGPMLGPVVGPIAGGYLDEAKGWRWSFWVVTIAAGAVTIATFIFLRESYAPAILEKKAKKLRKETGNPAIRSVLDDGRSTGEIFSTAIVRPTKMLLLSPIVGALSLYMAILYGYLYLVFTVLPYLFQTQYGFTTGEVGLTYLGCGIGSGLGLLTNALITDRIALRLTNKRGGVHQPEYRLPPTMPSTLVVPLGLFWFGWTAQFNHHWILPVLGTGFFGFGICLIFMPMAVYLVDAFEMYAASATAASTVLRSLLGALLPLGGRDLFTNLGMGWGSSLLGFLALGMAPMPFLLWKYGDGIRKITLFNAKF